MLRSLFFLQVKYFTADATASPYVREKSLETNRSSVSIDNLQPFSNYTFSVKASTSKELHSTAIKTVARLSSSLFSEFHESEAH